MEPVAKKQYNHDRQSHHTNLKTEECGIYLHKDHPYIGATPDMLVSCDCCGEGVLEIKCPLVPPCTECHPSLCKCIYKPKYLNYDENCRKFKLKENTAYYAQIQGQMALTGRKYADLYIYTEHAALCERISFNDSYWLEILSNLTFFYITFMAKHILAKGNEQHSEDQCSGSEEEPMEVDQGNVSFCPICLEFIKEQENIVTFHENSI